MILVDTGAWYASVVPTDPDHQAAADWLASNREPLLTTDFILDEVLTLLKVRGHLMRALALGDELLNGNRATIHYVAESELRSAWEVFRRFRDKEWSFTDCTSKSLIDSLQLTTAFAFDHHFKQFGTVMIVP